MGNMQNLVTSKQRGHVVNFLLRRVMDSSEIFGILCCICRGADKSLTRPTSRCVLFDGENISFDVSLVIYK